MKQSSYEWRNKIPGEAVDDAALKRQKKEMAVSEIASFVTDTTALTSNETISDVNSGVSVHELALESDDELLISENAVTVEFDCPEDRTSVSEDSDESDLSIQAGSFDSACSASEGPDCRQQCRRGVFAADCCFNCRRVDIGTTDEFGYLRVELSPVPSACITRYERRWITFDRNIAGAVILLCKECQEVLTNEKREHRKKNKCARSAWSYIWPVYMWKLLTNEEMLDKYGPNVLHWIPRSCHQSLRPLRPIMSRWWTSLPMSGPPGRLAGNRQRPPGGAPLS